MEDAHESVVASLHDGDPAAVHVLLERHLPGLEAYLRLHGNKVMQGRDSAEDVLQSVCREVLENADKFSYQGEGAFRNWLFTHAERKLVDRFRAWNSAKRDVRREAPKELDSEGQTRAVMMQAELGTPSAFAMAGEEMEALERAFSQLSDEYREVILKAKIIGLSHAAIAAESGRSEVATRKLLQRAMVKLGKLMGPA